MIREQQEEEENFRKTIQAETLKHMNITAERKKQSEVSAAEQQKQLDLENERMRMQTQAKEA